VDTSNFITGRFEEVFVNSSYLTIEGVIGLDHSIYFRDAEKMKQKFYEIMKNNHGW
jgi:hypothetical protein